MKSTAGGWDPSANSGNGDWVIDAEDSPCIDAGDFLDDNSLEPLPNGGRINIGAFGETKFASKSSIIRRYLLLDAPEEGKTYRYTCPITWRAYGDEWQSDDTLRAEYSDDGGQSWKDIPDANSLAHDAGSFTWNILDMTEGSDYMVRLTCNQDTGTTAGIEGTFAIDQPTFYYVNDDSTENDVYCTAVGNDANDGLAPGEPKATIQAIIDDYDLEAGDVIYIDTGVYVLSENIVVGSQDGGDADYKVSFVGSTHPSGTLINRNSIGSGSYAFYLNRSDYVALANLRVTGGRYGVHLYYTNDCSISGCRVYGNNTYGLRVYESDYATIQQNVIDSNAYDGIYFYYSDYGEIVNNTVCLNGKDQLSFASADHLSLRNNIIWADGEGDYCIYGSIAFSDYNDLYATNGAHVGYYRGPRTALLDWQVATGSDGYSMSYDPLFVDRDGADFHLQSNSPCIDAGDPRDPVGDEPEPNGDRINMGAYGGTPEATITPAGRVLLLVSPKGGEMWTGTQSIRWHFAGRGWQAGDTIKIEYSRNEGDSWSEIADDVGYESGSVSWDTATATPNAGPFFLVRITCNQNTDVTDRSEDWFTLHNQPVNYYVNDDSMIDDVYCTAVGNDANDGLAPATPKRTIQEVIDTYDLEPGDVVRIDTGSYVLSKNIVIGSHDSGNADYNVTFIGSTHPSGTLIDRNSTGSNSYAFSLGVSYYVTLANLRVTGGYHGIYLSSADHCSISGCRVYGNIKDGIRVVASDHTTIQDNVFRSNRGLGLYASRSKKLGIWHNLIERNGNDGIFLNESSAEIMNNMIVLNDHDGIHLSQSGAEITNNTISLNDDDQISHSGMTKIKLRNNIAWSNGVGDYCIYIPSVSSDLIHFSDYNDLRATDGAYVGYYRQRHYTTLSDWQTETSFDKHSVSCDPLFADPENGDFHLKSSAGRSDPNQDRWVQDTVDSPCIDSGDPIDSVGAEPSPNGRCINLGAYGGMNQASKTPDGRVLALISPNGREMWSGIQFIRWHFAGRGWQAGDTIKIEYSPDRGNSWLQIPGGQSVAYPNFMEKSPIRMVLWHCQKCNVFYINKLRL